MSEYSDRMVRVEEQVNELKDKVAKIDDKIDQLDGKLDDLLALRNKGAGMLWLISGLIGTGLIGAIIQFFHTYLGVK
jgi:hypothetical protein